MISEAYNLNTTQVEQSVVTLPVTLINREGINFHIAHLVASAAEKFTSKINVYLIGRHGRPAVVAKADSVQGLMSLGLISGEQLVVAAYGCDAQVAAQTLSFLLDSCLDCRQRV